MEPQKGHVLESRFEQIASRFLSTSLLSMTAGGTPVLEMGHPTAPALAVPQATNLGPTQAACLATVVIIITVLAILLHQEHSESKDEIFLHEPHRAVLGVTF